METLKAADIVGMIADLSTQRAYYYYRRREKLRITEITGPEGPIKFLRWNSNQSESQASPGGISTNQLAIVASVFSRRPNYPIHFDRLFSGGGNSRSALETMLACTPNFFICYPEKTNPYTGTTENRLKHIIVVPR